MQDFTIQNCRVFSARDGFSPASFSVSDGHFAPDVLPTEAYMDFGGLRVIPGLIDVHTHGRHGMDFVRADAEQLRRLRRSYAEIGVTTVVPTLASAPFSQWLEAVARVREAGFCTVALEGRYLNPEKRGVHRADLLALPSTDELMQIREAAGGLRVHLTVAPELEGAEAFIRLARSFGYTVALGHSAADYGETCRAEEWGVNAYTHLFNAMPSLHHRKPGPVCRALTGDGYCELICDGFHLHPEIIAMVRRCKSADRIVLITDSMEGTGCPDGEYTIAGETVHMVNGRALAADGTIGGSTLELPGAVLNFCTFTGADAETALRCATDNPARMLGIRDLCGGMEAGLPADFCVLDERGRIVRVFVGGREIPMPYPKPLLPPSDR